MKIHRGGKMAEEKINLNAYPEVRNKIFWEKVPKTAYPAELLDLIGYFDIPKDALVKDNDRIVVEKVDRNNKRDIIIAYPSSKKEEILFSEYNEFLREMLVSLQKIDESDNPERLKYARKKIADKEVKLFAKIATFFDILRMRALKMALNEFNSTYSRERIMLMEKINEVNNDE